MCDGHVKHLFLKMNLDFSMSILGAFVCMMFGALLPWYITSTLVCIGLVILFKDMPQFQPIEVPAETVDAMLTLIRSKMVDIRDTVKQWLGMNPNEQKKVD